MSARELLRDAADVVRRVIGVPDYDRYAAHMRTHHPDAALMTREEFIRQRLVDRYSKPGARCC
ncbi:MAG TPA: YbdD/YjiX family protein [Gemmatimonadaceae bacterium]|nr:YbdD/YjiX family protein [Gemmatimonadaceae bacterium]